MSVVLHQPRQPSHLVWQQFAHDGGGLRDVGQVPRCPELSSTGFHANSSLLPGPERRNRLMLLRGDLRTAGSTTRLKEAAAACRCTGCRDRPQPLIGFRETHITSHDDLCFPRGEVCILGAAVQTTLPAGQWHCDRWKWPLRLSTAARAIGGFSWSLQPSH